MLPLAKIIPSLFLALLIAVVLPGCGGGESNEDKALRIAQEWAASRPEPVVGAVVDLFIGDIPMVSGLARNKISEQVNKQLTWEYSEPKKSLGKIYQVTATVSTEAKFEVPILGPRAYQAEMPLNLQVDVETATVKEWTPVLSAASVGEK